MQVVFQVAREKWQTEMEDYLRACLPPLRLWQWTIDVSVEPPPNTDDLAHINIEDASFVATLHLGVRYWELPPDKQLETLGHELAHLHPYHATAYVETLKKYAPPELWDHFWHEFERKEDVFIDELARIFVPLMPPLPTIRRARKRKK